MSKEPIKVLIVDDHQLMIEGLKSLLEYEEDIAFVAGTNSMLLRKPPVKRNL